jgi:ornithine cyclodeaminase/alanine dehydrogenase-like protein (mu-crystallin family)
MDSLLKDVLRLHDEPCEHLTDVTIHQLLTDRAPAYLAFVREELLGIAAGRIDARLPAKQIFADPVGPGDFRVMPCILRNGAGVRKTVKLVGTNAAQFCIDDQITVGRAFALHPTDNFITHTFDACALSSARTGACAAIAVETLADTRDTIAVIGAGRVGYYAALYVAALGDVKRICVHDRVPGRAASVAEALDRQLRDSGIEVKAGYPDAPVDVAVLATISEVPIYGPDDFYAETVVSLGADTTWQRELDPSLATDCDVHVDTFDSLACGDLLEWTRKGIVAREELTDLLSLVAEAPRPPAQRRRLFISTGSALFDNLTIGYLLSRRDSDTLYEPLGSTAQMKSSYLPLRPRSDSEVRRTRLSSKG